MIDWREIAKEFGFEPEPPAGFFDGRAQRMAAEIARLRQANRLLMESSTDIMDVAMESLKVERAYSEKLREALAESCLCKWNVAGRDAGGGYVFNESQCPAHKALALKKPGDE